jgi:hypothetical protein
LLLLGLLVLLAPASATSLRIEVVGERGANGAGTSAVATAFGRGLTDAAVDVAAEAQAGSGVLFNGTTEPIPAGTARAQAEGVSEGGGDVTVTAIELAGAGSNGSAEVPAASGSDAVMIDAVRGATAGLLTLVQRAVGGTAGSGGAAGAARGGEGRVSLDAVNSGGGDLALVLEAQGGSGQATSITSGAGLAGGIGAVDGALARSDAGRSVSIDAQATGGAGGIGGRLSGSGGAGAGVEFGRISASSDGGPVAVRVEGVGGGGGNGQVDAGGDGASVHLLDLASGETSAAIQLTQIARGGFAGRSQEAAPGTAGEASSRVSRRASAAALEVVTQAFGGSGGSGVTHTGLEARGGDASSTSEAENLTGQANAVATSHGDGNDVVVGLELEDPGGVIVLPPRRPVPPSGAIGGAGGLRSTADPASRAGDGGEAISSSVGHALGDSRVVARDYAFAGDGGYAGERVAPPSRSSGSAPAWGATAATPSRMRSPRARAPRRSRPTRTPGPAPVARVSTASGLEAWPARAPRQVASAMRSPRPAPSARSPRQLRSPGVAPPAPPPTPQPKRTRRVG